MRGAIEFIVDGDEYSDDERLGIAAGLSITFRRVLVYAEPSAGALQAVRNAVWGALLISPCPPGLPCFGDVEAAADYSEAHLTPAGYRGPRPVTSRRRVSTFNKHYLRPWRWASGGEDVTVGHYLLPLMACIYAAVRLLDAAPVVVSDVRLEPRAKPPPDYMVIPTWHAPGEIAEIVDVYLPPLKASAIALGMLAGGYRAGPVIAVARARDRLVERVAELGGYAVVLDEPGDACRLLESRVVGYAPRRGTYEVDPLLCDRCGECLKSGCPALVPSPSGAPQILPACTGCGACAILCARGAIRQRAGA
jgi:hypothetical protein